MTIPHSLAIVDDHELVARGLAVLLQSHYDVPVVAHSGRELMQELEPHPEDCVLLDLSMPEQSGLEVLPLIKRRNPACKVIMMTMHADRSLVQATLSLGSDVYVRNDAGLRTLGDAIDAVR